MQFDINIPILGFEELKRVELEKIDDIFMKMKSVENKHISFILIDPFILREYDFEITSNIEKALEMGKNSNLLVLNILLVQSPIEDSVINFMGPIIFNTDTKKAAQVILPESSSYGVSEKISDFLENS